MKFLISLTSILLLVSVGRISAQAEAEKLPPSIRATGEAIVTAEPDRARIDIGVVSQSSESQAAVAQNAQKLQETLARIRTVLGANADIKTISYTLNPAYRYPQGGGEPILTGYTATNIVRITVDDLSLVGKVVDAATQAGANRVQQLQFTVKDEKPLEAEALRQAALNARRKSEALAGALGVKTGRILTVTESSPVVFPVRDVAFARAETAASTPIEPGMIEVRASVTLAVAIVQ